MKTYFSWWSDLIVMFVIVYLCYSVYQKSVEITEMTNTAIRVTVLLCDCVKYKPPVGLTPELDSLCNDIARLEDGE